MTKRKSLSNTVRFEVFKRDSFTCQYCGKKAPDVILEVDHINPVSKGGLDDIINLVTSCFECNRGKSDKKLSDLSIVEKQRRQIEELNIRRQQLEMILKWKDGLSNLEEDTTLKIADFICKKTEFSLNDFGINNLRKNIKKFGIQQILDAFETAKSKYFDGSQDSFENTIKKTYSIAFLNSQPEHFTQIAYAIGILKNKNIFVDHLKAKQYCLAYYEAGYCMESLIDFCKSVKNWTQFKNWVTDLEVEEQI